MGRPLEIFISHRPEDREIALKVAGLFTVYSAGDLRMRVSGDVHDVPSRLHKVQTSVITAELMLLLLTEPSVLSRSSDDWSAFEVGLFLGHGKPVFVLSSINIKIPSQFGELPRIEAIPEKIAPFLRELFAGRSRRDEMPVNLRMASDSERLDHLAREISKVLPEAARTRMHANFLILKIPLGERSEEVLSDDIKVEGDAMSFKMFGLLPRDECTWGDIQACLHGDTTWVSELGQAIHAISNGLYAKPIKSIISSPGGESFVPVVYRDELTSSGMKLFHVLFVPTNVISIDARLIFVISSLKDDMEPAYEAIKAAGMEFDLAVERVSDLKGDYRITDKILDKLTRAKYVVANLTHEKPNVYFELGYARGLGKHVITIVRKGSLIHFDVKDWTYIEYEDSRTLERDLVDRLKVEESVKKE
jgi:nucleoside 2-deoxyribosyltransferase